MVSGSDPAGANAEGEARSPDIFLSYSRKDADRASKFADALRQEGFEVWWDVRLRSGETFDKAVEKALSQARSVVVLWTHNSVASTWVRSEASVGFRLNKLRPVMLEPCELPVMFELVQAAPLFDWQGETESAGWRQLVDELREASGPIPEPAGSRSQSPAVMQRSESEAGEAEADKLPPGEMDWKRRLFTAIMFSRSDATEHEKRLWVTWIQALVLHLVFFAIPIMLLAYSRTGG